MGRKYSLQIRLYVMQERDKGKTWREVINSIKERFGIEAPTMRMMQKWLKETERERLSQMLVEETKKNLPQAGTEALAYFQKNLLPTLWQGIDAGRDIAKICCMWMMGVMEQTFGSATFEEALCEYSQKRAQAKADHSSWYSELAKDTDEVKSLSEPGLEQSEEEDK